MDEEIILAVDPGRQKCGLAVVGQRSGVLRHCVVATALLAEAVRELFSAYKFEKVIIGNRTYYKNIKNVIEGMQKRLTIIPVDEHGTTLKARFYYFKEHPPKSWRKLIPLSFQVPPCDYDDYSAIILAENYFNKKEDSYE